jgi:transposase-like protein
MAEPATVKIDGKGTITVQPEGSLSTKQAMAMELLINGSSISQAAHFASVTRQTVSRWVHEEGEFRQYLERWQTQLKLANEKRLFALQEVALDTLVGAMRDKQDVRAAIALLRGGGTLAK